MENKTFEVNLKMLRAERGISQTNLSRSIGVSVSTVGMYEQGRHTPDYQTIMKICQALNTTLDRLFGFDDKLTDIEEIFSPFINSLSRNEKLDIFGSPSILFFRINPV